MASTIRVLTPAAEASSSALARHVGDVVARGGSVLYLAADRPQRQVAAQLAQAGIPLDNVHFLDVVTCMDGRVPASRPANTVFLPSPTMLEMMAMRIEQMASRMTSAVVIVDSLNTLALYNGASAVQEFSHYLANRLRTRGLTGDFVVRDSKDGRSLGDQVASFADETVILGGEA